MQSENILRRKSSYRAQSVWLSAGFLAILVLVTAAVLGSCLYAYVHRSDYVIDLYGEQRANPFWSSDQAEAVTTHDSQLRTVQSSANGRNTASGSEDLLDVTDASQVWVTDTDIELFHTSYQNADGIVTVQSGNSDKVVAPGTDGSYHFSVKNTGKKAVDCKVWMETQMDLTFEELPFQLRMSSTNGWLIGGEEDWKYARDVKSVSVTEYIQAGKSVDYTLYWRWPFEEEVEGLDNRVGNATVEQEMNYTVTIHTQATESTRNPAQSAEDGKKADSGEEEVLTGEAAKTSDGSSVGMWILWLAVSGVIILYILTRKYFHSYKR